MPLPVIHIYHPEKKNWVRFPLTGQTCTIGRAPDNDLVLDHPTASRQHGRFKVDERGVWIMDLNSPNGILVNQTRIPPGEWFHLADQAAIDIGLMRMRLEIPAAASQPNAYAKPTGQVAPQPTALPLQRQPVAPQGRAPQPPPRKKWLTFAIALGVLAMCVCLVGGLGAGAWYFYPQIQALLPGLPAGNAQPGQPSGPGAAAPGQAAPTPTPLVMTPPQTVEVLPASAGSGVVSDSRGAALEISSSALAADQQAMLESATLSERMQQDLSQAYNIESLAYSVTAAAQDGSGNISLSLPAPSPDARLMVLVDNKYPGILDIAPQNGMLQVNPFLGAPLSADGYPTNAQSSIPNRYFVVTPKETGRTNSVRVSFPASRPMQAADPDGKSCITEFWTVSHCWRNQAGSVYVFWENNVPADLKDTEYLRVIDMIKAVEAIMTSYNQTHLFNNAAISSSNPVYVIIDPSEPEPTYSQKTGNVYMNWKAVGTITGPENRCALAHELMHFTQDTAYNMSAAALSNPKAWWLEMAAENAAFLIDPVCIDRNLQTYGRAVTKDNLLPLQSASLKWQLKEGARYIQALQMYVSLCEGGANCALSKTTYVSAINSGSYPFDDAAVVSAYQRSSKDMGLFMMGKTPAEANAGAHIIPSTRSGGAFAEYIWLKALPDYRMDISNNGAQISSAGSHEAAVKAAIAQGGEYPLWVSNGKGMPDNPREGYTSLPAMLKIDAGTKLWYMLDDQEPIFHDGGKELKLGPISDKLGVGLVRVVAIAPDAAGTFSASLKPLDLSGDWIAKLSEPAVNPINCPQSEDGDSSGTDPNDLAQLEMMSIFSSFGSYESDAAVSDGSHYIWAGTLPEGAIGESEITLKPDSVEVTYRLEIPKPTASVFMARLVSGAGLANWPPAAAARPAGPAPAALYLGLLAACALLAAGLKGLKPARRWSWASGALLAVVMLGSASWLSGCFGLSLWGTFEGTYTFKKLEYIDPDKAAAEAAPAADPAGGDATSGEAAPALAWKLADGTLVSTFDLFVEVTSSDSNGVETSEIQECKVGINAKAEGGVGPADMVPPMDSGE